MENKFNKFYIMDDVDVDALVDKEKDPISHLVVSAYKAGYSITGIKDKYGTSKRMIDNIFKKYNIPFRPAGTKPLEPKITEKIIEMAKSGNVQKKISEELNVKSCTINKILVKAGVEPNKLRNRMTKNNEYENKKSYVKEIEPLVYEGQKITEAYLSSLSTEEREPIAEFVFNYFRENGFPYPTHPEQELRNDWDNLLMLDSSKVIKEKILHPKFTSGLTLFKHFSHNFYHAKKAAKDYSYVEAFNDDKLLMKCINNRMGITYKETFNITPAMIKQGLRNSYCCSSCSIFNPGIAKYIYDTYAEAGGIVYDYSIGFGQRALGALSSGKGLIYIGCDPEESCVNNLNTIAKFLGREDKIYIEKTGSEDFCPNEYVGKVSLAFSSPPYFNLEYYSDNKKQAYAKGFDYFINIYWKKTVENIEKLLKSGGYLVLNITEDLYKNMKTAMENSGFVLEDTLYIQLSKNIKYKGNKEKAEPVYVFKKK